MPRNTFYFRTPRSSPDKNLSTFWCALIVGTCSIQMDADNDSCKQKKMSCPESGVEVFRTRKRHAKDC
jgi:hypothetical protein